MSARFVAIYPKPDDVEGFEDHYLNVHLPLIEDLPKVERMQLVRGTGSPTGGAAPYHFLFVAEWASAEDMQADLASEGMGKAAADLGTITERFGIQPQAFVGETAWQR